MITLFKTIQIILFSVFMLPSLYILIREPFLKKSSYRKTRLISFSGILLVSALIFILLSIVVTTLDNMYLNMSFAAFTQMWIIIKSVIGVYFQLTMILIMFTGVLALGCVCTNNSYSNEDYYLISFNDAYYYLDLMTTFDKIFRYSHFYLDCSVIKKKLARENTFIIGYLAYKELNKFDKKLKKESSKRKTK